MKKIVGILAAAAVATSAFAVDFSAGMQLKANLFEYDGASEEISAFKLWNENGKDDKPFVFSLSSDRVGATIKIFDSNGDFKTANGKIKVDVDLTDPNDPDVKAEAETEGQNGKLPAAMAAHAFSIWFKPFDALRIDLGNQDIKLNVEHITWWQGNIVGGKLNGWDGIGDWGYKATYTADAFTAAVAFLPGDNAWWFDKAKDADAALAETTLYVQYAADFGTINAIFDAKDTFKNLKVGAGFNGKFDDLGIFADVAFFSKKANKDADAVNAIAVDFDASYSVDAIGLEAYVFWKANDIKTIKKETMDLAAYFKASYALNGGSLYFKFLDDDLMADKFGAELHAGYDGNLGAMSYEVEAKIAIANEKVNFSVPCYFRVGF
ncbi:MAG: hypothetical protein J6W71_05505 [Methanobrevibacter sp.]|nr:hypothetical protein [Methanobrevibacter sp.]